MHTDIVKENTRLKNRIDEISKENKCLENENSKLLEDNNKYRNKVLDALKYLQS